MEHWPDGWDQVESTMIYNEKTVINLGPVGYFGQNGVYATGTTDSTMREFWKTWKTQSNVNLLPSMADTQAYLDSSNVSASTDLDKRFICDSAQYPWWLLVLNSEQDALIRMCPGVLLAATLHHNVWATPIVGYFESIDCFKRPQYPSLQDLMLFKPSWAACQAFS